MNLGHLFCFGYGYSARCFAQGLINKGWTVSASSRSVGKDITDDITFIDFNIINEAVFENVTHILVSIPPNAKGDPVLLKYAHIITENQHLRWIGYLSTTGVYGNTDGALVDECSVLNPTTERSKHRLAAEQSWLGLSRIHDLPIHVFRLAGIYGPGRNTLKQVLAGRAQRIEQPGHKFARIHVEDIARVLTASIAKPDPGEAYNVCDDEPASQSDVVAFACKILDIDPPSPIPFREAKKLMSLMAQSFWKDNRLVDNSKIKEGLGVSLLYPTYRNGLRAIFQNGIG